MDITRAVGGERIAVEGRQMYENARKKHKSMAGLDGWGMGKLALLPMEFSERLAERCKAILEGSGGFPKVWVEAKARFIPKGGVSTRPITIASAALRLFAGAALAGLTPWVQKTLHKDVTCLPGKGLEWSIEAFEHALEQYEDGGLDIAGVAIDQPKCFESALVWQLKQRSTLGSPKRLIRFFAASMMAPCAVRQ